MILERGDMWSVFGKTDLFLITTNPIIRKDGAVVMGRGIAKEAATRFPQLPYDFGKKLNGYLQGLEPRDLWTPTCAPIGRYDGQMILYFMVKDHWKNPADLEIIRRSTRVLYNNLYSTNFATGNRYIVPDLRVDLNFPGIGNGKLRREDVLPLIEQLPDNVHVWEYA